MKKVLILLGLMIFQTSFGQELTMDFELTQSPDVSGPKLNGGDATKFYEFINTSFNFDKVKKAGKMTVGITINELGELKNIRILEFPDTDSAIEMIRVIKLSPKWEPATRGGKPFSTDLRLPFNFKFKLNELAKSEEKVVDEPSISETPKENSMHKVSGIEQAPEFSGGARKFYEFIGKNYRTPDVEGLKGKVIVSFVVDVDGTLTDIKVLKDIGYGTGEEAIRVLKKLPKWTPGMQKGVPVRCQYTLPITIQASR